MQSNVECSETGGRVSYSRAEILALYDFGKSIPLQDDVIKKSQTGTRASRSKPQRKKTSYSQSSDGDAQKTHGSSGEDLTTQEVDPNTHGWHRMNRYAGHAQSGSSSHHPHQRYPSGPTGDVDPSIPVSQANGPLRPTNETKRGGHGDWSRGCAGWRQRSYSGSEQSDVFYYNHSNHRGRGNGHPSNEVDGNTGRGRGRGRGSGRQGLTHREPVGGQSQTSGSNACRPASCLVDTPGGQLVQQTKNGRIYSKSFCSDPPPGFDLPIHDKPTSESSSSITCQKEDVFIDNNDSMPIHHCHLVDDDSSKNSTQMNSKQSIIHPCNWYYIDLFTCTQGPFTNQQMSTWLAGGYLPLALKIRRDCDECFLSLADHMNLAGRIPFWTGYNQPPITHANLPSLSVLNNNNSSNQVLTHSTIITNQISSSTPPGITNRKTDCVTSLQQSTLPTFDEDTTQLQNKVDVSVYDGDKTQVTIDNDSISLNMSTLSSNTISSPVTDYSESQTINNSSSFNGINDKALLDLYNEAKNIALHTSKIEAERLILANKLAEINSTTAKLLSNLRPTQLCSTLTQSLIRTTNAVQTELARILEPCISDDNKNTTLTTTFSNTIDDGHPDDGNDDDNNNIKTDNDVSSPILNDYSNSINVVSSTKFSTLSSLGIELTESLSTLTTFDNLHHNEIHSTNDKQIFIDRKLNTNDVDIDNELPLDSTMNNHERNHTSQHTNNDAYVGNNNVVVDDDNDNDKKYQQLESIENPIPEREITVPLTLNSNNHEQETSTATKKSRRKNKKANKKLTPDEVRQLAWESEFNRRKAAALEQSLAEEARLKKLAEEEAIAIAAEKALAVQEKNRLLVEQRKREISRLKADSELAQLKLPESARWAAAATSNTNITNRTTPIDLRSIQASQAAEEAKRKYHDALISEQVAVLIAAEAASPSTKTPLSWSQIAKSDTTSLTPINPCISKNDKTTERSKCTVAISSSSNNNGPIQKSISYSSNSNNTSSLTQLDYLKITSSSKISLNNNITSAATSTSVSCTPKVNNTIVKSVTTTTTTTTANIPSIWDLPVTNNLDNTNNTTGKKSNSKKKKKNREVSLFPAKEELAHWCESQLSSIPLSGVDLPTLVDLLCELQATDEILEFIENSLGRSKRISQFSKDFLQKRSFLHQ
uniref:PERQ amino acid-rich with GYF domain-containing protein 2 n=3 Tax=Schistosoma haematobium TaxID=6185 RepID=A0A095C873_SCHHA